MEISQGKLRFVLGFRRTDRYLRGAGLAAVLFIRAVRRRDPVIILYVLHAVRLVERGDFVRKRVGFLDIIGNTSLRSFIA